MYFEFYPMGEGSGHDIQSDNWPDAISECQYYQPCAWNPVDRTDCFIKRRWNCWICSSGPVRPGRLTGLEVCLWRLAPVRCEAAIRPKTGPKQKCLSHARIDVNDPKQPFVFGRPRTFAP